MNCLPLRQLRGGLFFKNCFVTKIRTDLTMTSDAALKCESLFIEVNKNNSKIIVGGIYRHPNQNIELFTHNFQTILGKISGLKCTCVLAGDFNINLLNAETNVATKN